MNTVSAKHRGKVDEESTTFTNGLALSMSDYPHMDMMAEPDFVPMEDAPRSDGK